MELQQRVIDVFNQKQKAVVRILAIIPDSQNSEKGTLQVGTGFFISNQGHILTSTHITQGASQVYIEYANNSYPVSIIGADTVTNICILKMNIKDNDFDFLSIADNQEYPSIGTFLLATTCEIGLDPGPVLGMLTGYNLYYGDKTLPTTHIRSNIPSEGGEAGSPVFDLNGRFIGMIVASLLDIHSSFIIPAKAIIRIRDDILFAGKVFYGYLGIRIDEEMAMHAGQSLLIAEVKKDSPAHKAGLLVNDVILSIEGKKMTQLSDLHNAAFFSRPNQYLNMEVYRKGQIVSFDIKIEETPTIHSNDSISSALETMPTGKITLPDHQPTLDIIH